MLWNGVRRMPRFSAYRCMKRSSSASAAARRFAAVPGRVPAGSGTRRGSQGGRRARSGRGRDRGLRLRLESLRAARSSPRRPPRSAPPRASRGSPRSRARCRRGSADAADVGEPEVAARPRSGRPAPGEAVGRRRIPPAIAFPIVTRSGSSACAPCSRPGPQQIVCVSSIASSVPVLPRSSRQTSWNPGSGSTIPMFVSAGSASTQATSSSASPRSSASTSFHSTTRVVSSGSSGGPTLPGRGTTRDPFEDRQRLVDGAVVSPVEDQDLAAPGQLARQANRETVRVGRCECELPGGDANAGPAPARPTRNPPRGASA